MLKWSLIFFIVAIVAGVFGFGGIAQGAEEIAKVLFFFFIVIFILTFVFGVRGRKNL